MASHFIQWTRSLLFVVQMYLAMACLAVVFAPCAAVSRAWAYKAIRTYCGWVRLTADVMVGLKSEIRGQTPSGAVLVCSKHQSFLDIILLCSALPEPRFVMKKELASAPIIGYFAKRIGCVPVDRGKGSFAIKQMLDGVRRHESLTGQLIIYPQGTRVAPGARRPYKIGAALLYEGCGLPCIPCATNVGVFWPRRRIYRSQGTAVMEWLPEIPSGLEQQEFMRELETVVEAGSDRLMEEAGFRPESAG